MYYVQYCTLIFFNKFTALQWEASTLCPRKSSFLLQYSSFDMADCAYYGSSLEMQQTFALHQSN